MGNVVEKMKQRIKEAGNSKRTVIYFSPDSKRRVRFLTDLDKAEEYVFHSNFQKGIESLCQEHVDKACPFCNIEEEGFSTYTKYVLSIFDYDSNEVKVMAVKATGVTPIPSLIEYFEQYGTLLDRDYIIKKVGKGMSGSFVITPMEKETFKNKKAKPFQGKTLLKLLEKSFPVPAEYADEDLDIDVDDEDEVVSKKSSKSNKKRKEKKSIEDKLEELELDELKEICFELGMSKKEVKGKDEEDLIDIIFNDYDEEDIQDALEQILEEDDDEDEDDE